MTIRLAVLVSTLVAWSAPAAASPTADEVMRRVQMFYARIDHASAKFRQTTERVAFDATERADGKLWLQKPGKMRWEFASKKRTTRKEMITDGKKLYVIDPGSRQVIVASVANQAMPAAVAFVHGKGTLSRDFTGVLSRDGDGNFVLDLTPKKPSAACKKLTLVVAPDNYRVKRSSVVASNDDVTTLELFEADLVTPIARSTFDVDLGKLRRASYRIVRRP